MISRVLVVFAFVAPLFGAGNPRNCVGSVPIATFQIRVQPPNGAGPLPIRQVNTIGRDYKVVCTPLRTPPDLKKNGRMALVVVSTESERSVTVLDSHTFDGPAEWTMPFQVGVVLLVVGPQGLDEKRVVKLVSRDDDLVSELATYADQTEDLEDTIDTLSAFEDSEDDELDAPPVRGTSTDQVLFALTRALNPVMAAYNPLGAGKRAGPATMMGKASDAFFENAGGFVPGGGALPIVKTWLMPDTEFRTVYTEPAGQDGRTLCAQRKTTASHNRFVYLWAHRAINSGPPEVSLAQPAWLPVNARSSVPVKVKSVDQWPLVDRVREWNLTGGAAPVPVKLRSDQRRFIELDLRKTNLAPGTYHLEGKWDWGTTRVAGEFHLAPPAEAAAVHAANTVVEGRGSMPLRLEGADFQFVERVSLRKAGALGGVPTDLDYVLPAGPRAGPQEYLEVEIDTNHFRAGAYQLALAQTGGNNQNVPVRVLAPLPTIDNLPLRVNAGAKELRLVLRGSGLNRLEGLSGDHATFRLGEPQGNEREVFVSLDATAKKGDHLALRMAAGGVPDAAKVPDGIVVAGPRPRIAGLKITPPDEFGPTLREGELPAGSFAGLLMKVEGADAQPALRLECADPAKMLQPLRIRAGERRTAAKLDWLGENSLFASFDPGAIGPTGCALQAAVETDSSGSSDPAPVGNVVRLPRIDGLTLTNEKTDQGYFYGLLGGRDLEVIEKTGWDAKNGLPVPGPPRGVAGEGDRQTLRIVLQWPSPAPVAPLFIWIRGDQEGRQVVRK